jgi:hypothetical protein
LGKLNGPPGLHELKDKNWAAFPPETEGTAPLRFLYSLSPYVTCELPAAASLLAQPLESESAAQLETPHCLECAQTYVGGAADDALIEWIKADARANSLRRIASGGHPPPAQLKVDLRLQGVQLLPMPAAGESASRVVGVMHAFTTMTWSTDNMTSTGNGSGVAALNGSNNTGSGVFGVVSSYDHYLFEASGAAPHSLLAFSAALPLLTEDQVACASVFAAIDNTANATAYNSSTVCLVNIGYVSSIDWVGNATTDDLLVSYGVGDTFSRLRRFTAAEVSALFATGIGRSERLADE